MNKGTEGGAINGTQKVGLVTIVYKKCNKILHVYTLFFTERGEGSGGRYTFSFKEEAHVKK